MAQSFDGGASFDHFTVTDQPWDPSVDAPWAHGNSSETFIGDYFGLDASNKGFYPLWTDTRTGIQELWTAIVPEKKCAFVVNRSTLGQDEVDARRGLPGRAVIPDAFRVVVDGFTAAEIGLMGAGSSIPVASPSVGISIVPKGNVSATLDYGPDVQRFTFIYDIDFGSTDVAFGFPGPTEFLTLNVSIGLVSADAEIELIKQPNPFILHGDPPWLSVDLRVFVVHEGDTKFGVPMGADATAAPGFIQKVMANLTSGKGTAGSETFDSLPTDESAKLFIYPYDENYEDKKVFNFALAKVHYIGLIGATNVRVFFRLFQAQTTSGAFDPSTTYRRAPSNPSGQPIPLAGIQGGEYVTIPCFATERIDPLVKGMNQQTDDFNRQDFASIGGPEVDRYFGCWLDINQPVKSDGHTPNIFLPLHVPASNVDGPFTDPNIPLMDIQQAIVRNLHQCLIAEIAFDPVSIPNGKEPSNWDKLAQRNLAWSDIGSAQALTTFEIRPTPFGFPPDQTPDELMIDWGSLPSGSTASIYLPAVSADQVLSMAGRMYTKHGLVRADDHTLQCPARGITYIPIPPGANINYAGLFSIELPANVRRGRVFGVVVRQVTEAAARKQRRPRDPDGAFDEPGAAASDYIEWRRVLGAFQLTIPVKTPHSLLIRAERDLLVLRWIGQAMPHNARWYPVFQRYLKLIADRVTVFGGDPAHILPSPMGDGKRRPPHHREPEFEHRIAFTGKIAGLIFDHFGDFEGFLLETEEGEHKFFSREKDMRELAERAWRERLSITVWAERDEPRRPLMIVLRQPPALFRS
jgi:hypothetical protein